MTGQSAATRVLLVDDDPLVCRGLELILGPAEDLTVVGSVHDGDEVIDAIHRHRPDVVLMDVRMGRQDGIATTASLASMATAPKVLVLTTFDHDDVVLRAVRAGAAGFLLKTASPQEILTAIRAVATGEGALSSRSTRQVLQHVQSFGAGEHRRAAAALVSTLTPRERDVVTCIARGMSNAEAARELFMGEATVKSHLARAQDKLAVRSRTQVAVIVDRAGLLD